MDLQLKHRGEFVSNIVRQSGMSITEVAKRVGITRTQLYNWFKRDDLDWQPIYRIGLIVKYDFSINYPEIKPYKAGILIDKNDTGEKSNGSFSYEQAIQELNKWRDIAYRAQEDLLQSRQEIINLKDQYIQMLGLLTSEQKEKHFNQKNS
jgi:transcriptional regulator with XRE-family HTH domain